MVKIICFSLRSLRLCGEKLFIWNLFLSVVNFFVEIRSQVYKKWDVSPIRPTCYGVGGKRGEWVADQPD